MTERKRVSKKSSESLLIKHARSLTQKTQAKAKSVKEYRLPKSSRRRAVASKQTDMKQYANLSDKNPNSKKKPTRKDKIEAKRRKKAEYLASLPKQPLKRVLYRMHPKRFIKFWFSKDGGRMAFKLAGLGFLVALVAGLSIFAYFRRELQGIDPRNISFNQSTQFFDRTGETLLFTYGGDEQRIVVELDAISKYMRYATIAIEDKDFYNHGGFSVAGITRAAWSNIIKGDATGQGGSTITQQFIKNAVIKDDSQTYTRKVKELILAVELERLYAKDEILGFYLNQIPYGALEYGVEAAAKGFFNKSAKDLTIDEAAMMAAIPQAPTYYSPYGENTQDLVARQHAIIDLMREQNYINQEEADEAKQVNTLKKVIPIDKRSAYRDIKAPHFVLKVVQDLIDENTEEIVATSGWKVITTIDLKAQKIAEDAIKNRYKQGGAMGDNAALVAIDSESGQVIAYVGSRDFNHPGYGSFDAATPESGRQPGSSFKPYEYAKLFENPRWSPGSIIWDSPVSNSTFNGYKPNNFDFRFPGPMTVREAVGRSRNIPAVKAFYIAGGENVVKLARSMGLKSFCPDCDYNLSLALGAGEVKPSEHVHAFSTFAREGTYKPQTYVLKISNQQGEVLREWKDGEGEEQVMDPQVAYSVTNIMADDVARAGTFGLGSRLVVPGYTVAAKTGTTDLSVDGWLVGYSRHVTAGVWVGNADSTPMYTFAEPMVGPIWNDFMVNYHKGKKDLKFDRPEGIKTVRIDRATGRNATDKSRSVVTDIAPAWFKGVPAQDSQKVIIDTVSNKLATDCTPERARKETTSAGVAPELEASDPLFGAWAATAGYNAAGSSIKEKDDVHSCDDEKPEITNFSVTGSGGIYTFKADYDRGKASLSTVNFRVNGQTVHTCTIPSSSCSSNSAEYEYVSTISGNATVVVEIIDKLLYDDSATENTGFTKPSTSISFTSPINGGSDQCGFFCNIDWDSIPSADKYDVCYSKNGGADVCEYDKNNSSYSFAADSGADYEVTVTAKRNNGTVLATGTIEFEA